MFWLKTVGPDTLTFLSLIGVKFTEDKFSLISVLPILFKCSLNSSNVIILGLMIFIVASL